MITSIGKIPIIFINFTEIKIPYILFIFFFLNIFFQNRPLCNGVTDATDANELQKDSVCWIREKKKTCEINVSNAMNSAIFTGNEFMLCQSSYGK